jgi:hypothetical protein
MYLDHGFRLGLAVALSSLLILLLFSIVEIILRRTRVASSRSYLDSFRSDANSKKQIAARSPKHFSITLTFCFPSLGVIFSTGALVEMAKKKPYNLLEDLAICSHVRSSSSDEHLDKNAQATVQK